LTAADLIKDCQQYQAENGLMALLSLLEDIIECQAQAAGVELLDIDEDDTEAVYFTAH
jgi:hypothetical protein